MSNSQDQGTWERSYAAAIERAMHDAQWPCVHPEYTVAVRAVADGAIVSLACRYCGTNASASSYADKGMVFIPGARGFMRHIRSCHPELGDVRSSNILDHCNGRHINAKDAQNISKGLAPRTKIQMRTHPRDSNVETWTSEAQEPTDTSVSHACKPAKRFDHLDEAHSSVILGDSGWESISCNQCGANATAKPRYGRPKVFTGINGLAWHYRQAHQREEGWSNEEVYGVARRLPVDQQVAHGIRAGRPASLHIEVNTGRSSRDTQTPQENNTAIAVHHTSADHTGNERDSSAALQMPLRTSQPGISARAEQATASAALTARPQASHSSLPTGPGHTHRSVDYDDADEDDDDDDDIPLHSRKRRKTVMDDHNLVQRQEDDEPQQGGRIHPSMYPNVIRYRSKWFAISCDICGANASQKHRESLNARKPEFFRGISGLTGHYVQNHRNLGYAPDNAVDVLEQCRKQVIEADTAQRMRNGEFLKDPVPPYPGVADPPVRASMPTESVQAHLLSSVMEAATSRHSSVVGNDIPRQSSAGISQLAPTSSCQRDFGPPLAFSGLPFTTANAGPPASIHPQRSASKRDQFSGDDDDSDNQGEPAEVNQAANVWS